jgi:uncharacterized protein
MTMDELFAPPSYDWKRLSPKYLSERRLTSAIWWGIVAIVPSALIFFLARVTWLAVLIFVGAVAIGISRYVFLARTYRSWGYVEREDDLYITHGVWFRTLTAVPYGRMQLVEVQSGPVDRSFGLASVTLKTASPSTDATIPGLEPAEASRLRDRLTERGEAQASGL